MYIHPRGKIAIILPLSILVITGMWFAGSKIQNNTNVEVVAAQEKATTIEKILQNNQGKYILVHLDSNILELKDGQVVLAVIPIVSQGKPGSYYATIGGSYINDYKEELHLSSIGHVYMPYSVHIFGNYFIHGIPYYPDGTKVSSAFSGGCVRLADSDARRVYDFVLPDMPIIITKGKEDDFIPTSTSTITRSYEDMTRIMIAVVSLESLTQDNEIATRAYGATTRKDLLPKLLSKESFDVRTIYENSLEKEDFINAMNSKARSLGLTSTFFTNTDTPVTTTEEDYLRFMDYVRVYKSFLLKY